MGKKVSVAFRLLGIGFLSLCLVCCSKNQSKDFASSDKKLKKLDYTSLNFKAEKNSYAANFKIEKSGDFTKLTVNEKEAFLCVKNPKYDLEKVPENVTVLNLPLDKTYLCSSPDMDFINTIGALDYIRFNGTKTNSCLIPEVKAKMEEGSILFGGDYSSPDYESLLSENCNFIIENAMILQSPQTYEKLKALGFPIFVDYSSYEKHPLGRLEWIKVYGVLFDKEKEAADFYEEKLKALEKISSLPETGLKAAFFYVNSKGAVNVRKNNDYIAKMITLSGAAYIPENLPGAEDSSTSTVNLQMEEFFASASDCDILIYNGGVGKTLNSKEDLLQINSLFADFKAYKTGKVYTIGKDFYQKVTGITDFILEVHAVQTDEAMELKYLRKL